MKILLIHKFHYMLGGTETFHYNLAEALTAAGHEVIFFSMYDERNIPCAQDKYFVSNVDYNDPNLSIFKKIKMGIKLIYSFESKHNIEKLIRDEKPDIAHIGLLHRQITFSVVDVLKKYDIPVVMHLHELTAVCPCYTMLRQDGTICSDCATKGYWNCVKNKCMKGSLAKSVLAYKQLKLILKTNKYDLIHCHTPIVGILTRMAARKYRKAGTTVIYTTHGFAFTDKSSKKSWIVYFTAEKLMSRFCDAIITINHEDYGNAKKMHCPKVYVIPSVGLDNHRFANLRINRDEYRASFGVNSKDHMVLAVGELSSRKNQKIIIEALGTLDRKEQYIWIKKNIDIEKAWEYHRYCFNRSIIDGLVRSNMILEYKETYKECVSNLRKNIFLPLKMEKSIKKKIMWCCYFISPRLMAIRKAIGFKKAAKTVCGGGIRNNVIIKKPAYILVPITGGAFA